MKLYIDYVNKYEGAIQTIDKYKTQNQHFVNFLRVSRNIWLNSVLIPF